MKRCCRHLIELNSSQHWGYTVYFWVVRAKGVVSCMYRLVTQARTFLELGPGQTSLCCRSGQKWLKVHTAIHSFLQVVTHQQLLLNLLFCYSNDPNLWHLGLTGPPKIVFFYSGNSITTKFLGWTLSDSSKAGSCGSYFVIFLATTATIISLGKTGRSKVVHLQLR